MQGILSKNAKSILPVRLLDALRVHTFNNDENIKTTVPTLGANKIIYNVNMINYDSMYPNENYVQIETVDGIVLKRDTITTNDIEVNISGNDFIVIKVSCRNRGSGATEINNVYLKK